MRENKAVSTIFKLLDHECGLYVFAGNVCVCEFTILKNTLLNLQIFSLFNDSWGNLLVVKLHSLQTTFWIPLRRLAEIHAWTQSV